MSTDHQEVAGLTTEFNDVSNVADEIHNTGTDQEDIARGETDAISAVTVSRDREFTAIAVGAEPATSSRESKRLWPLITAGGAVVATAVAGAFMLGRNSSDRDEASLEMPEIPTVTAEALPQTNNDLSMSEFNTEGDEPVIVSETYPAPDYSPREEYDPSAPDPTTGVVRLARIMPGEQTLEAERPDGSLIVVPKLRSPENPTEFAESALALMACYFTTGSQDCLNELSTKPEVQANLQEGRDNMQSIQSQPTHEQLQAIIFDDPSNPAQFIRENIKGQDTVTLAAGSLYYRAYEDDWSGKDEWQHPNSRSMSPAPDYIFYDLQFGVDTSNPDEPELVSINYNAGLNSNG